MTATVIPLRLKHDETSALAGFDAAATELLAEGRAPTRSAAQLDAILIKLQGQRAELTAILADLEIRAPSGGPQIDAINATLSVEARNGLAQIDLFIQQAETCAMAARRGRRPA